MLKSRAFTLIELLIVVAIIAILAAIAVPNFLEAQTRSKVTRCKADMRTYATAIESYCIDYNSYPTMVAANCKVAPGDGRLNGPSVFYPTVVGVSARMIRLTTPVAYMTTILRDPFILESNRFALDPTTMAPRPDYDSYDYVDAKTLSPNGAIGGSRGGAACSGARWHMVGAGPDRINAYGGGQSSYAAIIRQRGVDYDPSNGTNSIGDIVRIGGGPGTIYPPLYPAIDRIQNKYYAVP